MLKRIFVFLVALSVFMSSPVLATKVKKVEFDSTHILIGKVKEVESYYDVNDWGDELILSRVKVIVERKLKGKIGDSVSFVVEGGTVGDTTLQVSEYPLFTEGKKVKLYLKKINHVFRFVSSETLESAPGKRKPGKKPGGRKKCCKTFAHWPDPYVIYHINPNNDDMADNWVIQDILTGASAWNSASAIELTAGKRSEATTVNPHDGNDIFFRDETSGSTIAVTYTWYYRKSREIVAFDMVFYDGAWEFFSYTHDEGFCFDGFYVKTIATHELGHAIGIDHNRCPTSIMYPYASYCDTNTLSDGDKACASKLYQ